MLYQQMLEEAVAEVKGDEQVQDSGWSPQISVGTSVMIPEDMFLICICAWVFTAALASLRISARSTVSARK